MVLEGTDGSGKTTLSRDVVAKMDDRQTTYCSKKEVAHDRPFVENTMRHIADILWPKDNTSFDHIFPPQYWIHLQATWYSLLCEFVISPRLGKNQVLITDGWYYKFLAKLILSGFDRSYLDLIFSHIIRPDLIILLDIDVNAIWERNRHFRWHEMGLHHGYQELGKNSFIDYQSKIRDCLRMLAQEQGWLVARIDPGASVDENSRIIQACISQVNLFV